MQHDVRVLDDFASGPADTVPLILLRHATALPRSKWKGDDGERPLDSSGRAEAKLLAPLLAAFAPRARVISSTAARCLDSVGPYAELTGAQVRAEQALQVRSSGTDPAASAALIAETIGAGEPAVVCAHRENVPLLQAAAIGALGPPDGTLLGKEWADELPTAGFWVLHLTPPPRRRRPRPRHRPGGGVGAASAPTPRLLAAAAARWSPPTVTTCRTPEARPAPRRRRRPAACGRPAPAARSRRRAPPRARSARSRSSG